MSMARLVVGAVTRGWPLEERGGSGVREFPAVSAKLPGALRRQGIEP